MIFAKISPAASRVQQSGPFSSTTVTGSYMTALARPYALGSEQVRFEVKFGEVVYDASGSISDFKEVLSQSVLVSGSVLSGWGTDDGTMLHSLASLSGTTVVDIVSGSIERGAF